MSTFNEQKMYTLVVGNANAHGNRDVGRGRKTLRTVGHQRAARQYDTT